MTNNRVVLIVIVAILLCVFLLLVLAVASFVLLPILLSSFDRTRSVVAVLTYEVEPSDVPVNMQAMVAAVDRP